MQGYIDEKVDTSNLAQTCSRLLESDFAGLGLGHRKTEFLFMSV